ncbi:MAG: AarF/ABC1/UbiB kinase family protein [Gammaproteobacteria bacterium]|nr:AarF/ABC1/UbiB kinase family protein [Gammaproteobacteria bacterium]
MSEAKQIKKIKQSALQRRLAVSVAGASGGARLLGNRAATAFLSTTKKQASREQALAKEARLFAEKLGELKGAYVKIGQMMALYGVHFLPAQITDALHALEDQTSSLEWSAIEPVIEKALGQHYGELKIQQRPIAAASLSQVHLAKQVKDNRRLCLKVQYPGVVKTIESDFRLILQMLWFTRSSQPGKNVDGWMQEIKALLIDEVDYHRERKMTQRIAGLLAGDGRYRVPQIVAKYSTRNVLAMEYLPGYEITHETISKLSQGRRNALAKAMLELFFKEIFEWGIMQTDPNFGNFRVQAGNRRCRAESASSDNDKLTLLDFGAVRQLEDNFTSALRDTIIAAYKNDTAGIVEGAIRLNCLQPSHPKLVKRSFADFCILLMEPFRKDVTQIPAFALNNRSQYKWHDSRLLQRVGKLGAKTVAIQGFTAPPKEFALVARKLTGVFTFVSTLRAEINAHKIIEKYL